MAANNLVEGNYTVITHHNYEGRTYIYRVTAKFPADTLGWQRADLAVDEAYAEAIEDSLIDPDGVTPREEQMAIVAVFPGHHEDVSHSNY